MRVEREKEMEDRQKTRASLRKELDRGDLPIFLICEYSRIIPDEWA
jgi:hypothetical protein